LATLTCDMMLKLPICELAVSVSLTFVVVPVGVICGVLSVVCVTAVPVVVVPVLVAALV
jgi:hypothetical protein